MEPRCSRFVWKPHSPFVHSTHTPARTPGLLYRTHIRDAESSSAALRRGQHCSVRRTLEEKHTVTLIHTRSPAWARAYLANLTAQGTHTSSPLDQNKGRTLVTWVSRIAHWHTSEGSPSPITAWAAVAVTLSRCPFSSRPAMRKAHLTASTPYTGTLQSCADTAVQHLWDIAHSAVYTARGNASIALIILQISAIVCQTCVIYSTLIAQVPLAAAATCSGQASSPSLRDKLRTRWAPKTQT